MVDGVYNVKVHREKGHAMYALYATRKAAFNATSRDEGGAYWQTAGRLIWFRYRINVKMKKGFSRATPSIESPDGRRRPYTGCDAPRLKRVAV